MIDETDFWLLIEHAWPATDQAIAVREMAFRGQLEISDELYSVQKQLLQNLTAVLEQLSQDDLLRFDRIFERKLYDIDRADIHDYTDGSDDGFLYCRGFIVSMGRTYYETVQAEPSRAIVDIDLEEICYLSYGLYTQKYGPVPVSGISRETGSNPEGWAESS